MQVASLRDTSMMTERSSQTTTGKSFESVQCTLLHLKLPTLKYRRLRGDMIEVFKITHDIYDSDASLKLVYHSSSVTRGNKYKLLNKRLHYDLRKHYLHVLLTFGIVYLITLWRLTLSTCSKHAWTGFVRTKMSNMISLPT